MNLRTVGKSFGFLRIRKRDSSLGDQGVEGE
jgi:hypothetical protein